MHVGRPVPRYRWIGWYLYTGCQVDPWIQVGRLSKDAIGRLVQVGRAGPGYRRIGWSLDTGCQTDPWIQADRLVPGYRLSD
jgi:hypothetical protein